MCKFGPFIGIGLSIACLDRQIMLGFSATANSCKTLAARQRSSSPERSRLVQEEVFCDEFHLVDLRVYENCKKVVKGCDHVFNLAADMGGELDA